MSNDENEAAQARPDGIGEEHEAPRTGWRQHASPLSLVVFGSVVALGMAGVLGHERDWVAEESGATLRVHAPETIRNGEIFEMRITVAAAETIDELVLGVDQSLWEDMTVNTMIPAATEEVSQDGEFRFSFGTMEAGTVFQMKVDLQVNPDILGGNAGRVTLYEGEGEIAAIDLDVSVLP
jgi:hypothetical protein